MRKLNLYKYMAKIKLTKIVQLGIGCVLILFLAAFGCKSGDEEAADTTEETDTASTEEVTFTAPTVETNTTNDNSVTPATNATATNDSSNSVNAVVNDTATNSLNSTSTSSSTQEEEEVLKLAETLAELYGTFTNRDKQAFKNLQDIKPYASQKMSAWIDGKVSGATVSSSGTFYGITTKALSSAVLDSSTTSYKVLITCQREEITEVTKSPEKDFQLLEMYFVQEDKEWKLDSAFWE